MNKTYIVLATLILIILVQSFVIVFRTGHSDNSIDAVKVLKEQIASKNEIAKFWENKAKKSSMIAEKAIAKSDSLEKLKPTVKHFYHETYKFIPHASNKQLDSLIRANW